MSLGQSGCAGGFFPLPTVIVQAVAEPPMGCTGGRRTAYVCDALFHKGRYGERPYRTGGVIVQAVAVPPMYAMLSLKKSATASARTVQAA